MRASPSPAKIAPGTVRQEPVCLMDLAATVLVVAGLPVPEYMQARPILDAQGQPAGQPRPYIFGHRDRMGETEDTVRTVRDPRFHYMRNYHPDRPYMQHQDYAEQTSTWKALRRLRHAEAQQLGQGLVPSLVTPAQRHFLDTTKPAEELAGAATMDPVQVQALREALGLSDAPLWQQYLIYLGHVLRFDFGTSFAFFPTPVSQVISTGLIWTVLLGMTSVVISFILGNILGVIASWRRGGLVDNLMPPLLIFIGAFPPFFLALMAFYFLANQTT